jgi:DNA repair photolyase
MQRAFEHEQKLEVETQVSTEQARSLIQKNNSPDVFFHLSINPYRGCEHGCIYCYARPQHSFLEISPGLDFETRLVAKTNAAELFERELWARSYQCEPINIGSVTDAYQPIERDYRLTRGCLEVAERFAQPVTIITKSSLIERDIDLLGRMAQRSQAAVYITITTLDAQLARSWEPRAVAPWRRLRTIETLAAAGIPVGVLIAPLVPFVNDHEIESIMQQAANAGARSAHYTVLRLPHELKDVFVDWLRVHKPMAAERVLSRLRDLRGGERLNDARFVSRMKGEGAWADLLRMRFTLARKRHGLRKDRPSLDTHLFATPGHQRTLFA